MKQASIVVSYRLHATLPSISFGTPTVNIVYDERAKSLFDDLGLTSHTINLIESGAQFERKLKEKISEGGYTEEMHKAIKNKWSGIYNLQIEQLNRFKDMVSSYIKPFQNR